MPEAPAFKRPEPPSPPSAPMLTNEPPHTVVSEEIAKQPASTPEKRDARSVSVQAEQGQVSRHVRTKALKIPIFATLSKFVKERFGRILGWFRRGRTLLFKKSDCPIPPNERADEDQSEGQSQDQDQEGRDRRRSFGEQVLNE